MSIDIPMDYPFKPPTLTFRCKVYHPNITDDGAVCIALLKSDAWKPSTQVADVLRSVVALLVEPNADDALVGEIAEVFRKDGARFEATAREWTRKFAQ